MLTQPALAGPLRDEKAKLFAESQADLLISTNLTCALNLSRGIREADRQIEVMHPFRLLAQQLI
jgi:glycolate oxidase iron-sulfur subunit